MKAVNLSELEIPSPRGRVQAGDSGLAFRVMFPHQEHMPTSSYLRELAASDCSPATLRSYSYAILRWLRFLDTQSTEWCRAERIDVRTFVEHLMVTPNPQRLRRRPERAQPGSVNAVTGKTELSAHYASRTINHQLSVLRGFYEHAIVFDLGPLVNPVPAQRDPRGGRLMAHAHPHARPVLQKRARYRQKTPRPVWRGLKDDQADKLFEALKSNRDRALLSFYLSSGARASELVGMRHGDFDPIARTITVVSKGSRAREVVPASIDSFMWLALYLEEGTPAREGGPLWWTRTSVPRPLNYHAIRAVLNRANESLGSNWVLHDLRHTSARRFLADPSFTLFDVQTILRHASPETTQIYVAPHIDDIAAKVAAHFARPTPPPPQISPAYDAEAVRELLGLADD